MEAAFVAVIVICAIGLTATVIAMLSCGRRAGLAPPGA